MAAVRKVSKAKGQKFQLFPCNMASGHEPVLPKTQRKTKGVKTIKRKRNRK